MIWLIILLKLQKKNESFENNLPNTFFNLQNNKTNRRIFVKMLYLCYIYIYMKFYQTFFSFEMDK